MNDLWHIVLTQKSGQERLCSFGVAVALKEDSPYESMLVHGAPQPVPDTIYARPDLVQKSGGTQLEFPLAQFFCKTWPELQASFTQGLMADHNAALVEHFLTYRSLRGKRWYS